ncbi:MAG: AMP-binding protein, partial [Gammaproteobacteria bacterium]
MRVTQALLRNAQQRPLTPATACAGRRRSWREFTERVARYAQVLRGLGLGDGDRVGIVALNSDHYLETFYAVPWAGGILVPLNTRWSQPELAYALADAGVRILVVDEHFLDLGRALVAGTDTRLAVLGDARGEGAAALDPLIDAATPIAEAGRGGDDVSGIFYTGGTTGRSKGVMLTHANHVTNSLQLAAMMRAPEELSYLHAAPMFHIADALCVYMVTALGGAHHVIPRFEPAACAAALQAQRVTDILLVPTMIQMLLDHLAEQPYDLKSLARLYYGASPIPEATLLRLFDALPDCAPVQLYGQTEAAPMLTVLEGRYHVKEGPDAGRLRAAGRAIPCIELKIVDEHDVEVPRGTV